MFKITKTRAWILGGVLAVGAITVWIAANSRVQFVLGGAMVNLGYRLQDPFASYDLVHGESITPQEIWSELQAQNRLASGVRNFFPRSVRHPVVAIVACMDARIDTSELAGDTRRYYYIVRTAGSVMSQADQEMLELAVHNGVKVVLYTTHSDCAAEAAAADPHQRRKYPALMSLMDGRATHIEAFRRRPVILAAIAQGDLLIKKARIDTETDRLVLE